MAKKTHAPKKATTLESQQYAAFIGDVLGGTIAAVKLTETRPGGKLKLEYDEP